jgi:hypothetical protein
VERAVVAMVAAVVLASRSLAADCNGNGADDATEVSRLSFEVVPLASGLTGPAAVVATDLDADGDVDVAVTEPPIDKVAVLKNTGGGAFGVPAAYPTGDTPVALVAGALGGAVLSIGSSIDLFTANFEGDNVTWLHNDGDGKFEAIAPTTIAVGNGPSSIVMADLNADDAADLVIANRLASTLTVKPGDGIGGFSAGGSGATAAGPSRLALADVTGDGALDLLIVARTAGELRALDNGGGPEATLATIADPDAVAAGDIDGDGAVDAAVASFTGNQIVLLRNAAMLPWPVLATVPVEGPVSVLLVDLDGDGWRDVAATSGSTNRVVLARNHGDGTFEAPVSLEVGATPFDLAAADVDGDGRRDLVVSCAAGGVVQLIRQRATRATPDCDDDGVPDACQLTGMDCNANGALDRCDVVAPQSFAAGVTATFTASSSGIALGDLNGDGRADLVRVVGGSTDQIQIHTGGPDGTLTSGATFPLADGSAVAVGDFDGDGDQDLAATNTAGEVSILRLAEHGTAAATAIVDIGSAASVLVAVDLEPDGDLDLVWGTFGDMTMGVLRNVGGVFTAEPSIVLTHFAPTQLATGDVDGDGDADVVGLNPLIGGTETRLYRNAGGTLVDDGVVAAPPIGTARLGIAFGDLDGDGDPDFIGLDVMLSTGSGNLDVYRNDAGTLTLTTELPSPIVGGLPPVVLPFFVGGGRTSIAIADFDGDGTADVATTDLDAGGARVFFGHGGLGFGAGTHLPGTLLQGGLLTGDVTGDGAPDLAVVTASGTRALAVYAANAQPAARDCTGDGVPDVCAADASDCNANDVPDTCELAAVDANGDGIPDCVERDAACGNCVDDDGDGALDLADPSCPSTPFTSLKATAAASKGKKPGKLVVNATVEAALPDLTAANPEVAVTVGGTTVYCGRPSLEKRKKLYKLAAPDGALKSLLVAVNAKKHRTKVRVTLTDAALAASDGAAFGVSLDAGGTNALHTSATLHAKGKRFVGP